MASAHELGASERVLAESGSVMLCRFAEVIGHHLDPFAAQCRLSSPGGNGRPFTAAEMLDRVAVTGRAVGICVRSIEIPVAQVGTLLGAFDVAMICISPDPLQFAILDRRERERRILWVDRRDHSELAMDIERLQSELKSLGLSTVPCLVYDVTVAEGHGAEAGGHGHHDHDHHHADPLKRLMALIRSESSDIWMVLVFALGVGVLTLATPIAIESLVNTVAWGQFLQPVIVLSLMLLVLLMFAALLRILQIYVVEIIQRRMFVRLAGAVSWRFPRVRQEACDHVTVRELANRFLEIATMQKASVMLLLDGVAIAIGSLVGMAVLAFYHPWLLGFDILLLVLLAVIVFGLGRGGVRTAIAESRSKYAAVNWFEQIASARLAFIDHHGRELAMERGDGITKEYLTNRVSHFRVILRQTIFALLLQVVSSTVLLGLGGWLVIHGQLSLGQLVAAEMIVTIIVGSFAKLGKLLESYYDLMASLDKVGHLVDLPLEEHQGTAALPDGLALSASFSQVEYSYPDSHGPVLHNVSIEIAAGSRVAITGSSASGKSTLLDLLYGLRTPQSGRVELNGYDLRDLRIDSVRDNVALVRSPEVIEGTILENLLIGRTDVPFDELRSVLSDVFLWEAIHGLPDGVTTHLAESGNPLSSQQICRLTVARALLKHPRLLLIDRTLDLLDESEQDMLWENLNRRREMTIVLVTGRERLARKCEQVIDKALRPASAAAHGGTHRH